MAKKDNKNPQEGKEGPAEAAVEKPLAPVCINCLRWNFFQKKCFYYWDFKKECSMKAVTPEEMAQ